MLSISAAASCSRLVRAPLSLGAVPSVRIPRSQPLGNLLTSARKPSGHSIRREVTRVPGLKGAVGPSKAAPQQPLAVRTMATSNVSSALASDSALKAETLPLIPSTPDYSIQAQSSGQLKQLDNLTWENTFVDELPGDTNTANNVRIVRNACYSLVHPSLAIKDPQLIAASASAARDCLGLDPQEFESPEFTLMFAGAIVPKRCKPYAQCYGGHQFGSWAGQLGDGRAITLGEVVPGASVPGVHPERWEVQLKGVGKTPYSRMADGRAVLRSSIREFLCSEAMHALGVPTTRALSVVTTGEKVLRDMFYNGDAKFEPGAAVCRLAPSLLRFGSFQLPVSRGGLEKELARRLADYAVAHHFPHLSGLPQRQPEAEAEPGEEEDVDPDTVDVTRNKYAALFAEVAERTGALVAGWQAVGFTHGVLNTDNMSLLGLTIDYGPFGFLDAFEPQYTPNTTDLPGRRYCFQNQPDVGLWNTVQLANALHSGGLISVLEAQHGVSRYAKAFVSHYERRMAAKLGLQAYDKQLTQDLLKLMAEHSADFTNTFRALGDVPLGAEADGPAAASVSAALLRPLQGVLGLELGEGQGGKKEEEWTALLRRLVGKVREEMAGSVDAASEAQRREAMHRANPKYILRNYLCQTAIEAAEAGDFSVVRRLHAVLQRPYEEQTGAEDLCQPAPEWAKRPGVCMLSCSS